MARRVTGSANQYLTVQTSPALSYPFSLSFWFKRIPTFAGGIASSYGPDSWDTAYSGIGNANVAANEGVNLTFGGATYNATIDTSWHLYVAVYTSATNRRVYLDNSAQTAVDNLAMPFVGSAVKNLTLGGLLSGGVLYAPSPWDGYFADAALWNIDLQAADVDSLAGSRPGSVKSANLKGWWKLGEDGDLSSSVAGYGPMVTVGSCPAVSDPPYREKSRRLWEISDRDYLPFANIGSPARFDDPLIRQIRGMLPFTERNCRSINDPLNSGDPRSVFGMPATVDYIPGAGSGATTWGIDGGFMFNGAFAFDLSADWDRTYWATNYPPLTISCWVRNGYLGGLVYGLGEYLYQTGIQLRLLDYGSSRVHVQRVPNNSNIVVSSITSTAVTQGFDGWMHVVVTLSADLILKLYCDGHLEGSHQDLTPQSIMNKFTLGADASRNTFFWGWIRDLRIWPIALQAQEISELYARGYLKRDAETPIRKLFPVAINAPPKYPLAVIHSPAVAKGITITPGMLSRTISAVRRVAFVKGITTTAGTTVGNIGRILLPEKVKGVLPSGGAISRTISKVSGLAHAKGVYFLLPPVLTSWAKVLAPGRTKGVTVTPGTTIRTIGRILSPKNVKGILPSGGLVSQTLARVMGNARAYGVTGLIHDLTFHGSLGRMLSTQPWASIERERRTLLGYDSKLELMSLSGHEWVTEIELESHWVARRARFLGTADEWLLEIPEKTLGGFSEMQNLAGARIYTHGQTLTFRITQTSRPLKAGHVWEFALEAIGDPQ